MATTFVEYTGDGNATKSFSFPSYQESDVKVRVDGVLKTTSTHYNITNYTTTGGGNVVFTSGNIPSSPANIRIYRDTNVDTAKATFTAGSSVKAADLNNNTTQLLYRAQEEQIPNLIHSYDIDDGAIETSKIKDDAITEAKIANDALTGANMVVGTITTAILADGLITTAKLGADSVTNAKIADDSIDSEHYVDGSIDTAHIADAQITNAKIAADAVTSAKIADNAVVRAAINANAVSTSKIEGSAVTTDKIADTNVTSAKLATGAVTNAKLDNNSVSTTKIQDANVTSAKLATGSVTTAKLDNLAVTTAKIANANITADKIASNAVTTDKIQDGELTTLAGMQSTTASNLASSTALTATTTELNQLDGITLETSVTTTSNQHIPTSKAVNDQILAVTNALGGFVAIADETSFPTANPDPSNGAGTVVSISQVSSGSAVSINSSGVATIANGAGTGNTVTITGFPTTLRNTSLAENSGLQVQTTTTLHTYTFHKQLASAADIAAISATVNSFSNRYRVSSSAPTSSLDGGDLWYDTTNSKLMVYSSQNSEWEEATAIGNFFISTISSSSSTGGGSATPNGTAYRFTISNAPPDAQQCLVSVDGVIQKPNSGSSQPSEGFVLVGNDIIFGAAPANGASLFVTVLGSTVGIGTPSNNTVTTAILQNGSVTTAKIVDANVTTAKIADANVTTAKIADDAVTAAKLANTSVSAGNYGSSTTIPSFTVDAQGRLTAASGNSINTDLVADTSPQLGGALDTNGNVIAFGDSSGSSDDRLKFGGAGDLQIYHTGSDSFIAETGTGQLKISGSAGVHIMKHDHQEVMASFYHDSGVELYHNNIKKFETTSTGISVAGNGVFTGNLAVNDNNFIYVGNSGDLQIHHTGGENIIDGVSGNILIKHGSERHAVFAEDGQVELYHDNSKKLETTSSGVHVLGTLEGDNLKASNPGNNALLIQNPSNGIIGFGANNQTNQVTISTDGHLGIPSDSGRLRLGAAEDLQIYHDGTDSIIDNNTAALHIKSNTAISMLVNNSEDAIVANANGAVELYHDNEKQFITTGSGATVYGNGTTCHLNVYNDPSNNHFAGSLRGYNNGSGASEIGLSDANGSWAFRCDSANSLAWLQRHLLPWGNNVYDLGSSTYKWRNIYTNDLHLSNEGSSNDVDGSWGDWTIQEGESDLFLKNNRSGKKYKFNLTEVS